MKVLLVTRERAVLGGTESYLANLIPRLLDEGHRVALVSETDREAGRSRLDDDTTIPYWCLEAEGNQNAFAAVAAWRPDVAYCHGLADPSIERDIVDRYPAVLFFHNYYGTCATGTKLHRFPVRVACSRVFGPACIPINFTRRCGSVRPGRFVRTYRAQRDRNDNLHAFEAIVVASDHMRNELLHHGLPPERLRTLPLPPSGIAPADEAPVPRTISGRLLCVSRLTDLKGVDLLLRAIPLAVRQLGGELRLVVAGDGPDRPRLEGLAARLEIGVDFRGWLRGEDRDRLYSDADLLVLPSVWPEPYGLVGLEAACFGCPAVAFDVGGISQWLTPGINGELAPGDPATPRGLGAALVRALADPGRHQVLREGAWSAAHRHTIASHVSALLPILQKAATLGEKGR